MSRQPLAGQHVVQLELRCISIRAIRNQPPDGDEVALQIAPVLKANLIASRGSIDHVLAIERRKPAASLEIGRDHFGDIERRRARRFPPERYDRNRHRVLLPACDLDYELRTRARRDEQQQCAAADPQESFHHATSLLSQSSALNTSSKVRSNSRGSDGGGNGEDRMTA